MSARDVSDALRDSSIDVNDALAILRAFTEDQDGLMLMLAPLGRIELLRVVGRLAQLLAFAVDDQPAEFAAKINALENYRKGAR